MLYTQQTQYKSQFSCTGVDEQLPIGNKNGLLKTTVCMYVTVHVYVCVHVHLYTISR